MLLVWCRFYWEESFQGTHLGCTWNISVPLQQMNIQGEMSKIFRKHIIWILEGKGPHCMLCPNMLTSKEAMAKHIEFIHGMDYEPNSKSSMCICCGKTNTTKKEVDLHIMFHTRKKQLGGEHCEKACTQ